jgi:hypothetical protein
MSSSEAANAIREIIRRELSACKSAIDDADMDQAKRALDDAVHKLKRIASALEAEA